MFAAGEIVRYLASPWKSKAPVFRVLNRKSYIAADAPALPGVVEVAVWSIAGERAIRKLRAYAASDGEPVVYLVRYARVYIGCI